MHLIVGKKAELEGASQRIPTRSVFWCFRGVRLVHRRRHFTAVAVATTVAVATAVAVATKSKGPG